MVEQSNQIVIDTYFQLKSILWFAVIRTFCLSYNLCFNSKWVWIDIDTCL